MSHRLVVPAPPSLPLAPNAYLPRYNDQLNNVLRLYFNQLNGNVAALADKQGARFLDTPYGQFSSTADQTAATTTDANTMEFNTTDFENGVFLLSASSIGVTHAGIYNVQFSAQFVNTDTAEQDVDVWFRFNGTDVPNSNSRVSVAKSHGSGDGHAILALNFLMTLSPQQPLSLMWSVTSTALSLQAFSGLTSPTRPDIPSIITTVTYVSAAP